MTLGEYEKKVCSIISKQTYWGSLTIDLCSSVCAASGIWSDMLNCSLGMTDKKYRQLEHKLFEKIGNVLCCLALLAREAEVSLSNIYHYAHHEGMGDGSVTKYILRMVSSAGEFLCPDMTNQTRCHKKIITDHIVLVMHDVINVIEAYKPSCRVTKDASYLLNDILKLNLTELRKSKEVKT